MSEITLEPEIMLVLDEDQYTVLIWALGYAAGAMMRDPDRPAGSTRRLIDLANTIRMQAQAQRQI